MVLHQRQGPQRKQRTARQNGSLRTQATADRESVLRGILQGTLDRNGWYDTYANNPPQSSPDTVTSSAISPNVFTGFLNFKHDRFTATVNPSSTKARPTVLRWRSVWIRDLLCAIRAASRGIGAEVRRVRRLQSCWFSNAVTSGYLAIPDPQTGNFDDVAQFREPWQLNMGLQFGYDVTPRIQLTATLANVVNTCFGGSSESWTAEYKPNNIVCGYAPNGFAYIGNQPGAGFFYGASGHDPANGTAGYPGVFN